MRRCHDRGGKASLALGAFLLRLRGVAYFSGTAWRFLPIKRAPRGSFDCAEWRVWQAPLLILSVDLAIYLVRTPLAEP